MICRSSMMKLPNGSWEVRVPLMSENGEVVTISPDELLPQDNPDFLRRNEDNRFIPDLRRKLHLAKGKEGLQVLEAAFIKKKFGSVDRVAADSGWSEEVLLSLGGDKFKRYSVDSATYNKEGTKVIYPGLASIPPEKMAFLDHYLENFDPEIHIATVSTKHVDTSTLSGKITDQLGGYRAENTLKFFVPGHAYSVSGVDSEKKIITLANPWDTKKPNTLTFDQFKKTFSGLNAIRIDSTKLLAQMNNLSPATSREPMESLVTS